MPAKKTTTKTTKMTKSQPKKVTTKAINKALTTPSMLPWGLAVLFLGAFVGTLFYGLSWSQKISGETMFVANGQTWMPVAGEPMELLVLNDTNCGAACDPAGSIAVLRQNITPALITETVEVSTPRGQELVAIFDIKSVPQYFFGEGLAQLKADDGTNFIDNLPEGFFVNQDGLYHLSNTQVGFRVGAFIEDPEFADLDTEPSKGTGPVTVVEFTDYQCPYCKRLHDQNKDLIARLISEDKITYILKDFPLNFHTEAVDYAHAVANCTLREGGQDAYWSMNKTIFDDTEQWSGKGDAGKSFLIAKASDLGVDINSCLEDPTVKTEIDADQAEGYLYGVSGTPALFIGGQVMPGAIGPDVFENAVNTELK